MRSYAHRLSTMDACRILDQARSMARRPVNPASRECRGMLRELLRLANAQPAHPAAAREAWLLRDVLSIGLLPD
jgi:hypothetical protein